MYEVQRQANVNEAAVRQCQELAGSLRRRRAVTAVDGALPARLFTSPAPALEHSGADS